MSNLQTLGGRQAKPLHRTFPTWARECIDGHVEWRIYAPAEPGMARFMRVQLPVSADRRDAAKTLRHARLFIWGHGSIIDTATAEPGHAGEARHAVVGPNAADATPSAPRQGALF